MDPTTSLLCPVFIQGRPASVWTRRANGQTQYAASLDEVHCGETCYVVPTLGWMPRFSTAVALLDYELKLSAGFELDEEGRLRRKQ